MKTWYDGSTVNDDVGLGEPVHNNGNLLKELVADVMNFGDALVRIGHRSTAIAS